MLINPLKRMFLNWLRLFGYTALKIRNLEDERAHAKHTESRLGITETSLKKALRTGERHVAAKLKLEGLLREREAEHSAQIAGLESQLAAERDEANRSRSELENRLNERDAELSARIASLEAQLVSERDDAARSRSELENRLQEREVELTALIASLEAQFAAERDDAVRNGAELESRLREREAELSARISGLESQLAAERDEAVAKRTEFETRLLQREAELSSSVTAVANIEGQLDAERERGAKLSKEVAGLESKLAKEREEAASSRSLFESRLLQREAELSDSFAAVAEIEAQLEAEREKTVELASEISGMTEQFELFERRIAIVREMEQALQDAGFRPESVAHPDGDIAPEVPEGVKMMPPRSVSRTDARIIAALADHERTIEELSRLYQILAEVQSDKSRKAGDTESDAGPEE